MRINTNIASMTAQENATNINKNLSSSLEKLSSGLRINKAADDASGMAIADKLRTQASSLGQAISNANSGNALVQIADKAMAEQSNILDIVKTKLIQASTATTSAEGREAIRKDVNKLLEQLDNIAGQTNYNGITLLQDSATSDAATSTKLDFLVGESAADKISVDAGIRSNTAGLGGGTTDLNGTALAAGESLQFTGSSAIMTPQSGVKLNINVNGDVGTITGDSTLILSNIDSTTRATLTLMAAADDSNAILTDNNNGTFTVTSGKTLDLNGVNISSMTITTGAADDTITFNTDKIVNVTNNDVANDVDLSGTITGGDTLSTLKGLGIGDLDASTAETFLSVVDTALSELNTTRSQFGSTQNQLDSFIRNAMTTQTNIKAAESVIRDVDYAAESANFNKQNIVAQAGTYAMSQANAVQQNVMRLLQ